MRQKSSQTGLKFLIAAILFLVTLAVFWPCVGHDFINFDDPVYVTENTHVQQGFTAESIPWAFESSETSNWHPLTWISHMLAWQLFGSRPAGHHFINILVHATNAALLFLVLDLMTVLRWRSLMVAALFALHPLRVESVAWIAERKDVLSATFWLLTMWAHVRYAQAAKTGGNRRCFYGLALTFFALALMSKPMVVTLPFALLLCDYWPLNRFNRQRWRAVCLEKWPYFLLSAIVCVITFHAQKNAGAMTNRLPFDARLETALIAYFRYLGKIFWPANLALPYPYPHHWPMALVYGSAVALVTISIGVLWARNKFPWLGFGWFWYLGTLVPVIGLIQVGEQSLADRYTYLPGIGILVITVWFVAETSRHWRLPMATPATASAVALGICICLSVKQLTYWQNSETLFAHTVAVTTDNDIAYEKLGLYRFGSGELQPAMEAFSEAIRIDPRLEGAQTGLAYILFFNAGQREAAIQQLQGAVQARPDSANLRNNLGMFYKEMGNYPEAETQLEEAARLNPDWSAPKVGLAYIRLKQGRRAEAIDLLQQALKISPNLKPAADLLRQTTEAKPP